MSYPPYLDLLTHRTGHPHKRKFLREEILKDNNWAKVDRPAKC